MSPPYDKPALRARLRAARDAVHAASIPVADAFRARLAPDLVVASYIPVRGEADPASLVAAASDAGCELALPFVMDRKTPLSFRAWNGSAVLLAPGPFRLLQPPADAPVIVPDVILTPLVGFDRRGNRLGQGAGHYDRAFAENPQAWRVGVAWSVQEVEALTPDAWDVPLHAIATEQEWITP